MLTHSLDVDPPPHLADDAIALLKDVAASASAPAGKRPHSENVPEDDDTSKRMKLTADVIVN